MGRRGSRREGLSYPYYWKVASVVDFNGDGRDDILWRNSSIGENYLYPMNGTTSLGGEGYLRTAADTAWRVVQVGDFDGDGRADILWLPLIYLPKRAEGAQHLP